MKKIVVPIDFSSHAQKALQRALDIASTCDCELHLVHVNVTKSTIFGESKPLESNEAIELAFERLLELHPHTHTTIKTVILVGKLEQSICDYAKEIEAFMIIMGTHGASGMEEFWSGTHSYKVARFTEVPVMTLRGTDMHDKIQRILLPIDGSKASRHKVPVTAELAKVTGAKITVLGVGSDDVDAVVTRIKNYAAQVQNALLEMGIEADYDYTEGSSVAVVISEYAKNIQADLISIMLDGETAFMNNFYGPYSQQLINHCEVPILCSPENKELEGHYDSILG